MEMPGDHKMRSDLDSCGRGGQIVTEGRLQSIERLEFGCCGVLCSSNPASHFTNMCNGVYIHKHICTLMHIEANVHRYMHLYAFVQ